MTFTRIRMQITLSAEPERVFKALTDSNALRAWFSEFAEIDLSKNQYAHSDGKSHNRTPE